MPNPNGAVAGNSQNIPEAQTPRTRSTFPLHYHMFNTHRFGELMPHYVEDLVKGDHLPIRSSHQLRSYTLDSPLLQNIKRNKDYFLVPMEAILPLNWEKFFDNPVRGDDVLDDVGPTVAGFWGKVKNAFFYLTAAFHNILGATPAPTDALALQVTLRWLVISEYFYSNGSLLSSLGCHGAPRIFITDSSGKRYSFDTLFDTYIAFILTLLDSSTNTGYFVMSVDGYTYNVVSSVKTQPGAPDGYISFRHALQLMRDNPNFVITEWHGITSNIASLIDQAPIPQGYTFSDESVPCNLSRLWAYQLCCAHYMSNDHIDFVYSAELYRQLIGHYLRAVIGVSSFGTTMFFTRNGIRYQYDYLSAFCVAKVLDFLGVAANCSATLSNTGTSISNYTGTLGFLSALFGYRRSLRYLDYFTGSRAQPLAVASSTMNTNVAVNSNQVSVIDITKSIQAQRFLNAVNKVRHSFEGYLKGVFGGSMPAPDYHNPFYLAHTDDVIFGQETENTGAAQMTNDIAITTNLRSNSGNYVFEIDADRPAIAIGITSYEITRVYTKSTERSFFHQNRFDWFNPFMQYIGDQSVYLQELGIAPSGVSTLQNFAYAIRHEEYKQRYSQAAGGFVENLPGWIFQASDLRGNQVSINPDWIRSLNAEFDQFYVSLTGWSLGSYFHFIVDDFNSVNASRPMAFAPTLL